jgi:hypothetical protein
MNKLTMRKRFALSVGASILLFALALAFYIPTHRVPDPLYRGQRLSHILDQPTRIWSAPTGRLITLSSNSSGSALPALQELGPRSLPLLISWLQERDCPFKIRGRKLCARFRFPIPALFQCRTDVAMFWLGFIPQHASSAAPELILMLTNPDELQSLEIVTLLDKIVETANKEDRARIAQSFLPLVPPLLERASRGPVSVSSSEIASLLTKTLPYGRFNSTQRESLLRQIMASTANGSPWTFDRLADRLDPDYTLRNELLLRSEIPIKQSSAAEFFRSNPVKPDRIIPLLRSCLSSTDYTLIEQSAKALGAYRTEATNVLPELRALLRHPSSYVVNSASNAIMVIDRSSGQTL